MTDNIQGSLAKTFDPAAIEAKWYAHWESTGAFRPSRPEAEPYTIVMPPPNVTGSLHIGHALDNTLPDILIRHARMCGKDALWVVGTDHAGIATQMVVERQLNAQGQKRTDFTREEFIAKVWEWKAESGGAIATQLRRLGSSCDWENERFTMDEGFSKAIIKVFVDLYNEGLLYRDKRLVNWDPGLKTAISDLEVETREVNGKFWHFRYPLADGIKTSDGKDYIVVATTRPETMLADMAVAVNAKDDRYRSLIEAGAKVVLPITGRRIPIITDDHADPELGSGAVKITPGHDFNDFEVGKRAGFKAGEMLNMLDAEAKVVQTSDELIPEAFFSVIVDDDGHAVQSGLNRFEARNLVIKLIDEADLREKVEDRTIQTPYGDRSGVAIEPWLTDQWYVDAETLAKPAIEAVRSGKINVVPRSWEKTYFNWMENIQPWCVSRQLWWGHQIPAWYGPDNRQDANSLSYPTGSTTNEPCVALTVDNARREFAQRLGFEDSNVVEVSSRQAASFAQIADESKAYIWRDDDVLDTWFSSALWPFGTLGWPDQNPPPPGEGNHAKHGGGAQADSRDSLNPPLHQPLAGSPPRYGEDLLTRHYPNDILISGFDILFFWDARMIMQGLHFMKEVPWKTLYLHGLVRAADGSKMSKSKGNTVDPLGLIDQYGADALRFTLTAMESQGRDIKLDEKRVEGYRNFATKLWNAARFCQANGIGASTSVAAPKAELAVNRWIIGEVVETLAKLNQAIADLRFDAMADTVYHFAWGTFCDWYLELIKPGFVEGQKQEIDAESKTVAGWVFDQILVMLHPFMPFITEELWGSMGTRECGLIHAQWPEPEAGVDQAAKNEIDWLVGFVQALRSGRTEMNIAPNLKTDLIVHNDKKVVEHQSDGITKFKVDDGPRIDLVERFRKLGSSLGRLARIEVVEFALTGTAFNLSSGVAIDRTKYESGKDAAFQVVFADTTYSVPLAGLVDADAERTRLVKAIEAATKERDSVGGRLNNPSFMERAKPEAVEKARSDMAEKSAEVVRLQAALARLG